MDSMQLVSVQSTARVAILQLPTNNPEMRWLRVLYLFCGKPRKADIKVCLQHLSKTQKFQLTMREVDIERSSLDDLTDVSLWDELF